ncbi:MAG TPA: HlyD family secretion protein [Gemmatimonadales bacterium]|nr:HlyD family secretion protein [Gemmatimonadales bacterium]
MATKISIRQIVVAALAATGVVSGFLYWRHARHFETTDDAQIDGNLSAVSARVPGTVMQVRVVDNQVVKEGDLLVQLDSSDLEVARAQALAQVALAEAQLRAAQSDASEADERRDLAARERERFRQLLAGAVISASNYDQRATTAVATAAAASAARKDVDVRRANLDVARAELRQAELNLGYARVTAPVAGIVGRKSVNVGDRVQPGGVLLFLTQDEDLWVTAYYRETQVRRMRIGQPVEIHVDATARDYSGRIESFGGATGSRYSLLPPENASGNFVKVVQRVPVRIHLDPGQADVDRLRPGMSAEPRVRVQ